MDNDTPKSTQLKWLLGSLTLPGTDFVSRCVGICLVLLFLTVFVVAVIWVMGAWLLPAMP